MVGESEQVFSKLSEQFHNGGEVPCLTDEVKAQLIKNVQRRMTPQPLKIRADVDLTCYAYDGVLHIQVYQIYPLPFALISFNHTHPRDCFLNLMLANRVKA